eukprot:CFRG6542T1
MEKRPFTEHDDGRTILQSPPEEITLRVIGEGEKPGEPHLQLSVIAFDRSKRKKTYKAAAPNWGSDLEFIVVRKDCKLCTGTGCNVCLVKPMFVLPGRAVDINIFVPTPHMTVQGIIAHLRGLRNDQIMHITSEYQFNSLPDKKKIVYSCTNVVPHFFVAEVKQKRGCPQCNLERNPDRKSDTNNPSHLPTPISASYALAPPGVPTMSTHNSDIVLAAPGQLVSMAHTQPQMQPSSMMVEAMPYATGADFITVKKGCKRCGTTVGIACDACCVQPMYELPGRNIDYEEFVPSHLTTRKDIIAHIEGMQHPGVVRIRQLSHYAQLYDKRKLVYGCVRNPDHIFIAERKQKLGCRACRQLQGTIMPKKKKSALLNQGGPLIEQGYIVVKKACRVCEGEGCERCLVQPLYELPGRNMHQVPTIPQSLTTKQAVISYLTGMGQDKCRRVSTLEEFESLPEKRKIVYGCTANRAHFFIAERKQKRGCTMCAALRDNMEKATKIVDPSMPRPKIQPGYVTIAAGCKLCGTRGCAACTVQPMYLLPGRNADGELFCPSNMVRAQVSALLKTMVEQCKGVTPIVSSVQFYALPEKRKVVFGCTTDLTHCFVAERKQRSGCTKCRALAHPKSNSNTNTGDIKRHMRKKSMAVSERKGMNAGSGDETDDVNGERVGRGLDVDAEKDGAAKVLAFSLPSHRETGAIVGDMDVDDHSLTTTSVALGEFDNAGVGVDVGASVSEIAVDDVEGVRMCVTSLLSTSAVTLKDYSIAELYTVFKMHARLYPQSQEMGVAFLRVMHAFTQDDVNVFVSGVRRNDCLIESALVNEWNVSVIAIERMKRAPLQLALAPPSANIGESECVSTETHTLASISECDGESAVGKSAGAHQLIVGANEKHILANVMTALDIYRNCTQTPWYNEIFADFFMRCGLERLWGLAFSKNNGASSGLNIDRIPASAMNVPDSVQADFSEFVMEIVCKIAHQGGHNHKLVYEFITQFNDATASLTRISPRYRYKCPNKQTQPTCEEINVAERDINASVTIPTLRQSLYANEVSKRVGGNKGVCLWKDNVSTRTNVELDVDENVSMSLTILLAMFQMRSLVSIVFCVNSMVSEWMLMAENAFPSWFEVKTPRSVHEIANLCLESRKPGLIVVSYDVVVAAIDKVLVRPDDEEAHSGNEIEYALETLMERLGDQIDLVIMDEIMRMDGGTSLGAQDDRNTVCTKLLCAFVDKVRICNPNVRVVSTGEKPASLGDSASILSAMVSMVTGLPTVAENEDGLVALHRRMIESGRGFPVMLSVY